MKVWCKKSIVAGLTLMVLGIGLHMRETPLQAQAPTTASASAQTPEKSDQEVDENEALRHSPMVRKMGGWVGLNANQSDTLFEITNFLLLLVAIGWAVVKFLPGVLRGRTAAIQKNLVDARTATEEAHGRLNSVEDRLSKLDGEIAGMRAQAETDSAREEQRIRASVEEEAKKILASAEQEINAATMHAQKQLQQHAAELAIEQAARKLVVSAETDRLLVQGFAQRLSGDDSKKGQN